MSQVPPTLDSDVIELTNHGNFGRIDEVIAIV